MLPARGLPALEGLVGPAGAATGSAAMLWAAYRCLEQRDARGAVNIMRRLAASNAQIPLYHLYLGWSTYAANPKTLKFAERCVLEASRLARRSPEPFYLMDSICTLEGDTERAAKFRQRAEKLAARGPKLTDLLSDEQEREEKNEVKRLLEECMAAGGDSSSSQAGKGGEKGKDKAKEAKEKDKDKDKEKDKDKDKERGKSLFNRLLK
jgi:hypothetical protein